MSANKIYFHTFGCKVNQCETETLRKEFVLRGWNSTENFSQAQMCLVNSCAVTADAERECRQFIRRLLRQNPQAKIVLTGCYPQIATAELKTLFPQIEIFRQQEKGNIVNVGQDFSATNNNKGGSALGGSLANSEPQGSHYNNSGRQRAFVKIQDGCPAECSYCIVPFARPDFWFQEPEKVKVEVRNLVATGYKEIVLTGIRLGKFPHLLQLLQDLELIPGLERIRLSSLEITEVSDGLINFISNSKKIARHLHLPLQSGDEKILKAMNRWYTPQYFADKIALLREKIPDIGITTDVIVGFPGESEENFGNTYGFIEKLAFSGMHIFSFSSRPGTVAGHLPDHVTVPVKKNRYQQLKKLDNFLRENFIKKFMNKKVAVLVEGKKTNNCLSGFSSQYFRVCFPEGPELINNLVSVKIESSEKNLAYGKAV